MVSPQVVGVVVLDPSLLAAIHGLPTSTEATPPGPSPMVMLTPLNVIAFQREEEEGAGQVGVVREAVETIIRVAGEEVDIGTEGTMTRVKRSPD